MQDISSRAQAKVAKAATDAKILLDALVEDTPLTEARTAREEAAVVDAKITEQAQAQVMQAVHVAQTQAWAPTHVAQARAQAKALIAQDYTTRDRAYHASREMEAKAHTIREEQLEAIKRKGSALLEVVGRNSTRCMRNVPGKVFKRKTDTFAEAHAL
jgi:hypothetical protein